MKLLYIAGFLIVLASVLVFYFKPEKHKYIIPVDSEMVLSEDIALQLSKKALQSYGKDISMMKPVMYWNDNKNKEKYFARNKLNKNRGYILWHHKDSQTLYEYIVMIEKYDNKISCDVLTVK